ncbi:UNVERIFIED_CONTAM: hypothetical protein PYX00_007765 [Menopon gallinae]|uniref:Serpin domain-containing protein n=1 Tax=Menopon gallinae TaxID=328185 RepID=A0AAW2HKH0_9NEOP
MKAMRLGTRISRECLLLVLICAAVVAFPTEDKRAAEPQAAPDASNSTTSSTPRITLHPQDKKQFLSYVLGNPKKPASLKTPSHLMNPDKYEFYTFDDDGQIVKKLMSVQEIQRIIANNERGRPTEPHNPNEYYQIITVSPDVEPPPAVSRINPSEPLFSVHDVIASVQNVLKSEINLKRAPTRRPTPGASETSESTAAPVSNEATNATDEDVAPTTYRPKIQIVEEPATTTVASEPSTESEPLSLSDAHPGLVSNDTFLEPQPSIIEQLPQIELKSDGVKPEAKNESKPVIPESTISQVQIPMNQDLAESVSSVLSQIASEISLGQIMLSTEPAMTRTNAEDEDNNKKKTESINVDDIYLTTELPETTTEVVTDSKDLTIEPQNDPKPFENLMDGTEAPEATTTEAYISTTLSANTYLPTKTNDSLAESKEGGIVLTTETEPATTEPVKVKVPEEVTPSDEDVRPPPEKLVAAASSNNNQTVEGVELTPDGYTGRIPRPTESPDVIVKNTERAEMTTLINDQREPAEARVTEFFVETTTDAATEVDTEVIETTTAEESKLGNLKEEETTEVTTETAEVETRTEAESKLLPELTATTQTAAPETTQKQSPVVVSVVDDVQGSVKQNIAYKPFFSKPQKPVYIKPTKIKTPAETKPTKTGTGKPVKETEVKRPYENHFQSSPSSLELEAAPAENLGLEATTNNLDRDVKEFADLCNELAFSLWSSVTHGGLSFVRSVVVSPFAVTSLLAMVFLGARGPTSGQMNDVLKLDEMVTFNPHLVFRNVTESLVISRNPGVATAAFVRELYSDKSKGKLLDFYKERAQQFYDGHVEEVNFKTVGDVLRRQTNLLVKRQTWGKITDFLRGSNLQLRPPLAAFSANIFQTDCTKASTKDRDGEMYFVVLPASRLRRLVPVPAVVIRDNFLAGYEPNLDATAVALYPAESAVSTVFVLPGQQGLIAPGDTLARLEHHLLGSSFRRGHWTRLMKSLLPRPGLELQIPRLSHRSVINVTASLQRMGLRDLFSAQKADLTGLNGLANDLHLSDMLQVNLFSTCGEDGIGTRHVSEVYPATPLLRREKSSDTVLSDSIDNLFAVSDFEDPAISAMPLELRPRQARVPLSKPGARIPEPPRLRFDRPFLFFVRHNPTGLILHMGRFNPRLTT